MTQTWVAEIEEDEFGELVLVFPEDLIKQLGWKDGDSITWDTHDDGTVSLVLTPAVATTDLPTSKIIQAKG